MRDISLCTGPSARKRKKGNINIYGPVDLQGIRDAAGLVKDLLKQLYKIIRPGINELDIATFCENYMLLRNGDPFLKSSGLYKHAVLISRNNKAYHGIPENRELNEGDIVSVDVVVRKNGWFGDGARTYEVGNCPESVHDLVEFSRNVVLESVESLRKKPNLRELSDFISLMCRDKGFRVLEEGAGHGIGRNLHEEPIIRFGDGAESVKLVKGMVFTIEPVITDSFGELHYSDDGTAFLDEGFYASQFEHMVVFGENGLEILTGS